MKKIIAAALLLSIITTYGMPALAINTQEDTSAPKQKRSLFVKKSKVKDNQYKFDYINLGWWDSFGDEYLSAYIKT